jgi:DNA invertase Pin-like site-specific DNA recombinase
VKRVADYARFSDEDLQERRSIPDQQHVCRSLAERIVPGCGPVRHFSDEDVSGSDPMITRPGLQALLAAASRGEFDILVIEDTDRLSRDGEDLHRIYKLLTFAGVQAYSLNEGLVTDLVIGFKATMNAQVLKGLGQKTRRGLVGQFKRGRWVSRCPYGYRFDRSQLELDKKTGQLVPVRGVLVIHPEHAALVLRIFKLYAAGFSGEAIAKRLNTEGIPGPGSKPGRLTAWGPTTINGNWRREVGFLNNPLYIGQPKFGKLRYEKDPTRIRRDGKKPFRRARLNDSLEWETSDVFSHLRIPGLTDELWQQVKDRQAAARQREAAVLRPQVKGAGIVRNRRPPFLFSGLTKCDECRGGYTAFGRDELRCHNKTKKKTCSNTRMIKRQEVEARVLRALQDRFLADPVAFEEFCAGFREEQNRFRMEQRERITSIQRELDRIARDIFRVIDAIKAGVPGEELKTEMEDLQARKAALLAQMVNLEQPEPLLHPSMAVAYRVSVEQLAAALQADDEVERSRAREAVRALIEQVVIPPGDGLLRVVGNLGKMLEAAGGQPATGGVAYVGCGGSPPIVPSPLLGGSLMARLGPDLLLFSTEVPDVRSTMGR